MFLIESSDNLGDEFESMINNFVKWSHKRLSIFFATSLIVENFGCHYKR